jgi:hypothetical protein
MLAETVFNIAIHLPEKELEKLYRMLSKKINPYSIEKPKRKKLLTDKEAIDYLLKNLFHKRA